ncbi:hypothetical protein EVAR_22725_1 [Eumeta japonica]|uniref:Uncharacterized protein n=1 Tax=Eumeta variegata TaxID=151549 RepID=A0A4C1USA3_EUMVA|nr:hypothetical protein EVAR_22725_1 [Eumeta japonica]
MEDACSASACGTSVPFVKERRTYRVVVELERDGRRGDYPYRAELCQYSAVALSGSLYLYCNSDLSLLNLNSVTPQTAVFHKLQTPVIPPESML